MGIIHLEIKNNRKLSIEDKNTKKGFGTFKGVYLPSTLTILGVIMYLRFGWVLGNVGPLLTLLIVTMSSLITFLTGLSICFSIFTSVKP